MARKIVTHLWFNKEAKEAIGRVTQAFLKMKKFNVAELERAYEGET